MAKVIIGIHGLDNKPAKHILETWWKNAMVEGLNAIGKKCRIPKFEIIYWADTVYDKPLNLEITNKEDPYYIDEVYTPIPLGFNIKPSNFRLKIVGSINKLAKKIFLNQDLTMKYNGLAESIVEKFFKEMEIYFEVPCTDPNCKNCRIRKQIIKNTVDFLRKYKDDEILLIGHSMGSVIGYDVLMYEYPEIKVHSFITMGSPLGIPYVISKIAAKDTQINNKMPVLKTPNAILNNWYNFSDIEDNIALNYSLAGEFAKNDSGIKPTDILVRNNYMMNEKRNPHKSFGYLRTPEFAKVLAAFIEERETSILLKFINKAKGVTKFFGNH